MTVDWEPAVATSFGTTKHPATVVGCAFVEWVLKGRRLEDSEVFAAEVNRYGLGGKPKAEVIALVKEALIARARCDHQLADLAEGWSLKSRPVETRLDVLAAHLRMENLRKNHES